MDVNASELAEMIRTAILAEDASSRVSPKVRGGGREGSFNLRLANGQQFRIQVEEL